MRKLAVLLLCTSSLFGTGVLPAESYPANGRFDDVQRPVYEAVLKAQDASIALMRQGHTFREMNDKAVEVLGVELLRLGLISRNDPAQVRWYLPYPISHQIGLAMLMAEVPANG